MKKIKIGHRVIGAVATNVYLVIHTQCKEAFLIDPADRADYIAQWVKSAGVQLKGILLTHGHFDHIAAVNELKREFQVPVYALVDERAVLADPFLNLSESWIGESISIKADVELKDEQQFEMAGFQITAYHTPGHTKGSVCYYLQEEGTLFSGDTLFCHSVGRTDFPTGSMGQLVRSVRRLIETLPEETVVYPGHEASTTIAEEKRYNPYI